MDSEEHSIRDDYDTVITVNKDSLSLLIGRTIDSYEWSLVCTRKDCMSCGRDENNEFKGTTFTANDLHCYMLHSKRILSKLLWQTLVESQTIDEHYYVSKYGLYEDFYFQVMKEITDKVFMPEAGHDAILCYWQ